MAEILGFDPLSHQWSEGASDDSAALDALDVLVQAELERRAQARAEKNWAVADEVRDRLAQAGITVTDSADGATRSEERRVGKELRTRPLPVHCKAHRKGGEALRSRNG